MLVEKECHVKKNVNICGLIHELSMGWWEECIYCEEKTDLSFSEFEWRREERRVVYYCKQCEEIKRIDRRKAVLKYPFVDDEST